MCNHETEELAPLEWKDAPCGVVCFDLGYRALRNRANEVHGVPLEVFDLASQVYALATIADGEEINDAWGDAAAAVSMELQWFKANSKCVLKDLRKSAGLSARGLRNISGPESGASMRYGDKGAQVIVAYGLAGTYSLPLVDLLTRMADYTLPLLDEQVEAQSNGIDF